MTWKRFPHYWPFWKENHTDAGFPFKGSVMHIVVLCYFVILNNLLNKKSSCRYLSAASLYLMAFSHTSSNDGATRIMWIQDHEALLLSKHVNSFAPSAEYASVNRVNIGSDNVLSPYRRQSIIWTNTVLLLIGPLGTNFSENWIKIQKLSVTKRHLGISSAKWRPFRPGGWVNWSTKIDVSCNRCTTGHLPLLICRKIYWVYVGGNSNILSINMTICL